MSRRDPAFRRAGRVAAALLAGAALLLPGRPAGAVIKLEGEYNLQLDIRKQDRAFEWDFESNNNDTFTQAQFRLFAQPKPGIEAFVRYEAEWNTGDNNGDRPIFYYREAHGRYRWELPGQKGFDTYLFSRQSRFWVDNYLIPVVRDQEANDGGNAQGLRIDSFGFLGGMYATAIVSDFSGQTNSETTDDAYILRLRRNFDRNRVRSGLTYNRKVENQDFEQAEGNFAEVYAGDLRYSFREMDFSIEYAQSRTVGPGPGVRYEDGLDQKLLGITMPNSAVLVGEIRSLRVGNARSGYLNIAPTGWFRGPTFDNRLGDSNRDEKGYALNSWYLVPGRAITLTNNLVHYEKKATLRRTTSEYYGEAFIEFVNGFTGRTFYRRKRTTDTVVGRIERTEKNDDIVMLLSVESRLAWFRMSGKIKNLDTAFQKELVAIEASLNLGDKTKLYTRLVSGNDPTGLRRAFFTQLQYRPTGNMELFLEYGPGWIGDAPLPVDDGDLEGSGSQKDIIKLFLKGTF